MLRIKTWVLNEKTGDHTAYNEFDSDETDLDFMTRFYKKFGWRDIGVKYDEFDVLLTRVLDWNHTEFLGIIQNK